MVRKNNRLGVGSILVASLVAGAASAAPTHAQEGTADRIPADARSGTVLRDNYPNPFAKRQARLRTEAVERLVNGEATARPARGGGSVVTFVDDSGSQVAVELLDNDKQDSVWTVLAEFGDESSTRFGHGSGPLHNEIPEPDRDLDNTTPWTDDFDIAHYEELFNGDGESFRNYYLDQSDGAYTATSHIEDWTRLPRNGRWYGDNKNSAGNWTFIGDTVDAWYEQAAAGRSRSQIDAYLSQFDVWDRYDFDEDGRFNEPDGYIDQFQTVFAGEGEESGGGALGSDALHAHRWYADPTGAGSVGPTLPDGTRNLRGGKQIGSSRFFVGDYTMQPENGGVGLFAHEYAHMLGLPDTYDTAANQVGVGGETATAFWDLMSAGEWLSRGDGSDPDSFAGLGTLGNNIGPEARLHLGWLDYVVAPPGTADSYTIDAAGSGGPVEAVVVPVPGQPLGTATVEPVAGRKAWHSGHISNANARMTRDIPAGGRVTVSTQAWYDTEEKYDYWFAEYSLNGGATWRAIGQPIDGESRGWQAMTFRYDTGGAPSQFRFRYATDSSVNDLGVFLDEIVIQQGGRTILADGAEAGRNGWRLSEGGWHTSSGSAEEAAARYYILEHRGHVGPYEDTLRTGPYNWSEDFSRYFWVEHFPYQDGMLVWLVNHAVDDNNTSQHPGEARAMPVDAHLDVLRWPDGSAARDRIQVFDATFGLETTDPLELHREVAPAVHEALTVPARPAVATFDDRLDWYDEGLPTASVRTVGAGVIATVTGQEADAITVHVTNQLP